MKKAYNKPQMKVVKIQAMRMLGSGNKPVRKRFSARKYGKLTQNPRHIAWRGFAF